MGQPFELVGIDIIGPLTPSFNGHQYIVVAIDYLTKWAEARPIRFADSTEVTAFLYEDIISRHGIPKQIIMDNGSHFINMYIASICSKFGIKHNHTSAYNPQANGLVERLNQTIANSLKCLDPSVKQYWDNFIPATLYAYRTLCQSTTKYTPFYLTYGRNHNPLPLDTNDLIPDNDNWTDQLDAKLTE
jgi:transposase InsO family protein